MLLNKFQKISHVILIVAILGIIGCADPAPEPDATTYLEKGDNLFNDERYIEAIKEYTKAIELNPNLESAYIKRGDSQTVHLRRYEEGIEDYTKAIEINPNNDVVYIRRALNYENLENYDLAQKDSEKALQINPSNIQAHHIIGKAHYGRGEYQKAVDAYDKALEIDPEYGPANFDKEIAEVMLTQQ
jgi:tetratricopeptide (TPR) repeat protein